MHDLYSIRRYSLLAFILAAHSTMLFAQTEPRIADHETYLTSFTEDAQLLWPKNRTLNIVCHGHSVPAGFFKTPVVDTFNAYPHLLHQGLKNRYPHAVLNVIVTAIGGEDSVRGAARFEEDVLTHRPDLILIDYALNDRRSGLEAAEEAWRTMIESSVEHDVPVLLLTPTGDFRAEMDDPSDPLNQHADQIRRLAAEYGVGLVDSWAAFQNYVEEDGELEDLMSQVNHPNRTGHDLVVEELLDWFPE